MVISILSLLVAVLAVFFGPLVAWTVARQQITVAARETWLRTFREQVAALISAYDAFLVHVMPPNGHTTGDPEKEKRLRELHDAQRVPFHTIRLLIAETGQHHDFISSLSSLLTAPSNQVSSRRDAVFQAAEDILCRERAAIVADPGVLRALLTTLKLRLVGHG
jgi:hypothetical protein